MQSELLYLTLCTHGHRVSDCRMKMCGIKGKVSLTCTGLRTDCSLFCTKILKLFIFLQQQQIHLSDAQLCRVLICYLLFSGTLSGDNETVSRTQN